jgi:thiol-disulfide isomerase/thioredoxin
VQRRQFLVGSLGLASVAALPRLAVAATSDFDGPIRWQSWEAASKPGRGPKQAICLVLYADWCPHCHELAPAWRDDGVVKLSAGLHMVHQNVDERPEWLQRQYGRFGSYVPRVLFLRPDLTVMSEVTSGNPRFPYFYQPHRLDALRSAMTKAAATVKG